MIAIDNFVFDSMKRLEDLKPYNCLDIRSYKKNRKVIIEKLENKYNLYEYGFHKEEFKDLSKEELKKLLNTIEKREFPRSNKLRFYILDSIDSSVCRANYREEIEEDLEEEKIGVFLECSYNMFAPIKNIIEENNDEIKNSNFSNNVTIEALLSEDTYKKIKNFIKDKLNISMYTYY